MGGNEKQEEKKEMKVKINLGCGKDIRKGWINVDKIEYPGVDVVHDLNEFPWPFDDNFADYILMNHVLEHLNDVVKVMGEVWRILKPGGIVEIYTPYYKSKKAFRDPTHKYFFHRGVNELLHKKLEVEIYACNIQNNKIREIPKRFSLLAC